MDVATTHHIPGVEGDCRGFDACGTCHVYLDEATLSLAPPLHELESSTLTFAHDVRPESRLTCQIPITDEKDTLSELSSISELCRVQSVSPNYARAIAVAGFKQASEAAGADPIIMTNVISRANEGTRFYKDKLDLRDARVSKRCTVAAN